jgi:hypothetical protein
MTSTVIYLTSNKEDEKFENKIREDLLLKTKSLPIISVSQKQINLGKNICVGDVGASGFNFCRQVLIACEEAKTDFVIHAEADCLYSPDYFYYQPERLDVPYRNTNIFVQKYGQDFVCKKSSSTFSQVVGREFYIKRLKFLLEGQPMWSTEMKNFPKEIRKSLFDEFEYFHTQFPCISFKTGKGMRRHSNSDEIPLCSLPHWGDIKILKKKLGI